MPSMEELHNLDIESSKGHNDQWGIDKKIPVALILVVVFQTVAITWGAATLSSDVRNGLEKIDKLEENLEKYVEKADSKFETRRDHQLDKENAFGEIKDIKEDINELEARVRYLEQNLK